MSLDTSLSRHPSLESPRVLLRALTLSESTPLSYTWASLNKEERHLKALAPPQYLSRAHVAATTTTTDLFTYLLGSH